MKNIIFKNEDDFGLTDSVADFNSKTLFKEVSSPYPLYNGYLAAGLKVFNDPSVDDVQRMSFSACASSVFLSNCLFRLNSSLQAYCDFIQLITRDQISNVYLYESLKHTVRSIVELLESGNLFREGAINEHNSYNFVFSFSSSVFNQTVDFMYRNGIVLSEKLYADISKAVVIYSEAFKTDLEFLMQDYFECYKPYLDFKEKEIGHF